ncbi:2-succinyl-5-enolpyruvyl-6-hydroxy-3-cyclohexene-1-carboxylic-acid synthase [Aestuariimicrobium soli]|uniref:2-succinyl-5-enolpyruvyl-6-hydroxy-3- cyclohexene-1-carboxylic-acid synthase n=1 Tax=Aestuariimicrobium soli TaxID=2035834 RepID=UPI003EB8F678
MSSPELARAVVATLIDSGVREVVLSPGSRNAGLGLALATADAAGLLRLHVRVDERTAGFLALGLAKAGADVFPPAPVAVVTTSGTAVANLHPAVAEARHSGLPLVVLSADRPLSLRDSGSNQTTRQLDLLAPHTLDCVELADESGAPAVWRRQLVRALAIASGVRTRQPGPVQVNLALATPLLDPALVRDDWLPRPGVLPVAAARPAEPTMIAPGPRTVVVCGDATPSVGRSARRLAERLGVPLLAEPSSGARSGACAIAGVAAVLGSELAAEVERVIVFGHPTLSRPMTRLLSRSDVELIMVSERADWIDTGWAATRVVDSVEVERLEVERVDAEGGEAADPSSETWLRSWIDHPLAGGAAPDQWGADLVVQSVLAALADDEVLMLGSSSVVRCADRAPIGTTHRNHGEPLVLANRGLAGIDGTLSTALGVRLATGRATTALVGDLTFVHDLGALVGGELEESPGVRVVVVDDHGGGIFAGLEQGEPVYARHFARVFGTPQRTDLAAAARGLGAEVVEVDSADELAAALSGPHPEQGWQVLVARV